MPIAHTKNARGTRQDLVAHLTQVAAKSAEFAAAYNAAELGYLAGLLHDIGKFNPEFQRYLLAAETNLNGPRRGPDHKGAGSLHALALRLDALAFLVAGHHGGLPSRADLKNQISQWTTVAETPHAISEAIAALPSLSPSHPQPNAPDLCDPLARELFIRMLFSALVDADFLDTEQHFSEDVASQRASATTLENLWTRFQRHQVTHSGLREDPINAARHHIYQQCLDAAELAPGFFRLTAPTGGGKTLSSLGFGLAHARKHGLNRVIYAIPYTSIIEQTSAVFRGVFAGAPDAVLEHHSAVTASDPNNPTPGEVWSRLMAENWDAPLIVTTTVQLLESLLGRSTSACRKLHNVARSVIILDEAQMLPTSLLTTTLDVLRQLVERYGATVVLCTATQPALDERAGFPGLPDIRDILPDATDLFAALKRVEYDWPAPGETVTWEEIAADMRQTEQALAIVNTRADAEALFMTLGDPDALHLSTWMCGAHRRTVLAEARGRLDRNQPCRLVSTQLIEAGVDIDFPLVLRALGPLDRIVQSAGRCNREGRLVGAFGRVRIFVPEGRHLPPGSYRTGTELTAGLLRDQPDLHDPSVYTEYFRELYRQIDPDVTRVQDARRSLDYPAVAKLFKLIEDETSPVVVRYGDSAEQERIRAHLMRLRNHQGRPRDLLRALQPFIVGLRPRELSRAQADGLVEEVMPGLWEWHGEYDAGHGRGIVLDAPSDPGQLTW